MSSPAPDLSETSRILLKKAEEDATAVREFAGNPEIGDSIIGFHAQQAVEKWLKAVTAASGVRHSTIHDIDRLIEIAEATGIEVSLDRDRLAVLTRSPGRIWVASQLVRRIGTRLTAVLRNRRSQVQILSGALTRSRLGSSEFGSGL